MIFVLGLCVVIIWGMIIYRVVKAVTDNDDDTGFAAPIAKKQVYDDYAIPKDTAHLQLNYRDPFGIVRPIDTVKKRSLHVGDLNAAAIHKPSINWGFIKYAGYIRSGGVKTLLAIMHVNGKAVMMKEGETVEHVKLLKNLMDSIKIDYQGKTKFIPLTPGS